MTHRRSAASLMASGAATITLAPGFRAPKLKSIDSALNADKRAIAGDGRRVAQSLARELGRV